MVGHFHPTPCGPGELRGSGTCWGACWLRVGFPHLTGRVATKHSELQPGGGRVPTTWRKKKMAEKQGVLRRHAGGR